MPVAINKKTSLAHDPVTFPKQTINIVYARWQNRFKPNFVNVFFSSDCKCSVNERSITAQNQYLCETSVCPELSWWSVSDVFFNTRGF